MKNINLLLLTILFFNSSFVFSQEYFQQEVNNKIDVKLDDQAKTLDGSIEIEYINNSPDTLEAIYFHLWPNAYKNNETAYALQQLEMRSTDFYYYTEEQRGYIDSLKFIVNDEKAEFRIDEKNIDIGLLILPNALSPRDTITISTDFFVKIPEVISRLGYSGNNFYISQWYPKPAVYDEFGWHPMSYLDMGEFYSEFGRFEVSITLPEDYIVASTGNLITKKELQKLEDYAVACKSNRQSDIFTPQDSVPNLKTIKYIENNIHDFAWFASKDFW